MLSTTPFVTPLPIDEGVRPAPGAFSLILAHGSTLGELETRLLLDAALRGEDTVLICGDNRLDAYGLLARARSLGLEDALADGVHLARAFTVHQFLALLEETLPYMTRETGARFALVTGLLEPFSDEDVTEAEMAAMLPRSLRRLDAFAQQAGISLVATADARSRLAPLACAVAPHREVTMRPETARQPRIESFAEVA